MTLIEIGKGVILKKGNNIKYVCVSSTKTEKMENFYFSCKDMIGKPFGTAYKVVDKKRLEIVDPISVQEHSEEYENEDLHANEVTQDNRDIQDSAASQKLSRDQIMSLRDEGVAGEEIVQELVENSATFKDRTEYSKAKYLKKKKKKYLAQFIALKPTTRLLTEMYFIKSPNKILEMRPDTFAQILAYSNLHSDSNVLLLENCQGLLLGAIMKRLVPYGKIVQFYQGSYPVRIITEQFNFLFSDIERTVTSFPLEKLAVLKDLLNKDITDDSRVEFVLGKTKDDLHIDSQGDIENKKDATDMDATSEVKPMTTDNVEINNDSYDVQNKADNQNRGKKQSWHRNIQVLPNRTHPEIVMSATGGYILKAKQFRPHALR